jgi:hypothetical protein
LFLTLADIYFSSFQFMVEPEKVSRGIEMVQHMSKEERESK